MALTRALGGSRSAGELCGRQLLSALPSLSSSLTIVASCYNAQLGARAFWHRAEHAWGSGKSHPCLPTQWSSHLQQRSYSSERSTSSTGGNAVLSNTTSFLRNLDNGAEVFLVGTAHVSKRSADEVRDMIRLVKPDVVMVELCAGRAQRLRAGQPASEMNFFKDALSLLAPGGLGGGGGRGTAQFGEALFKLSLSGLYRFLKSLGMDPGGEFKVAMEEAERLGARVVYGDREVNATMQRLASSLSFQDVLRMMAGGGLKPPSQALVDFFNSAGGASFESQVEAMKTRAMAREMSNYMRQLNPQLAAALIDERDQIMVDSLRQLSGRVVGVVGLAHLDGIEARWAQLQHSQADAVVREY